MRRSVSFCVLTSVLLAGCSTGIFESKKIDYKSASSSTNKLSPLEVPPDLTTPTRDDRYAVPDVAPKGKATYSAYSSERAAAGSTTTAPEVLPVVSKIRVERNGNQRWLVVPSAKADEMWPQLKDFWQELGFIINIDNPEIGVMETDWAEDRAKIPQDFLRSTLGKVIDGLYSVPERDKFRTRVEKGSEPNSLEIYISHRGMSEIYTSEAKDKTIWQPRPADPELEAEMLNRLMVRLGVDETRAKAAVTTAATTSTSDKARLDKSSGTPQLQVQESFDRAWRRIGLALDRVGFTVEDRDRSAGTYFVRYVDPEQDSKKKDDGGFLNKLAFWRSSDKPAKAGDQFRILVKAAGDTTQVQVISKDGANVDISETRQKILTLLLDQLK